MEDDGEQSDRRSSPAVPEGPGGVGAEQAAARIVTRRQLLELGFSRRAIEHRLRSGRLHRVRCVGRGVYVVGWPEVTQMGRWMAAVLACGPGAAL